MPSNTCVAANVGHLDVLKAILSALRPATLVTSKAMNARSEGAKFKEQVPGVLKLERLFEHVSNAQTSVGRTPLLLACENGCVLDHLQAAWNCGGLCNV